MMEIDPDPIVSFLINERAVPQGSKSSSRKSGGIWDCSGKRLKDFRNRIAEAAINSILSKTATISPLFGPIFLDVEIRREKPKWLMAKKGKGLNPYPTKRPDLFKCVRAIEDALAGIVYFDDSQIVQHKTKKVWSDSGKDQVLVAAHKVIEK